jgi:diguanylate cyclase (GGDEF)-like protein
MSPPGAIDHLRNEILEALARGISLETAADRICRAAEAMAPGTVCSILTVDEQGTVHPLAGPSLPEHYSQALEGLPVGPCAGSCGTAIWRGEPVEVRDIATDPLWAEYKALALPLGLRACWSSPIKAGDGRVVGTFAFYYREPRGPAEVEREIVDKCAHLCAIAIEHHAVQSRIHQLAFFDALTGLPNRAQLQERAHAAIDALDAAAALNVLYIDLDDFKGVNDALGHRIGDQLLERVARRLTACMDERAFIARLGGDEFAVLQAATDADRDGSALAQAVIDALREPFEIDDHRVSIGASVGITQAARGADLAELYRQADMALYEAKNQGRGTWRVFAPQMEAAVRSRRSLQQALRGAIDRREFALAYQPIVALATRELVAVEALLRWRHPERGDVPPAIFVPVVEEMGLIGVLGDWVLQEACAAAATWPRDVKVCVNLSPLQLKKADLAADVVAALNRSGLPAERLDLEITESALLAQDIGTRLALHGLHDLGVRLSLDDFGMGYSSLRSLRSFPFDKIKIDMSFVRGIGIDRDATAIIRAMIGLARDLGIRSAAEGIETDTQLEWLSAHGCTEGQGFYFGEPMHGAQLHELLAAGDGVLQVPPVRSARGR